MYIVELYKVIDDANTEEDLKPLVQDNIARIESACVQLTDAFRSQNLDLALELTVKLQY